MRAPLIVATATLILCAPDVRGAELGFAEAVRRAAASEDRVTWIQADAALPQAEARTALGAVLPSARFDADYRLAPEVPGRDPMSATVTGTLAIIEPGAVARYRASRVVASAAEADAAARVAELRRAAAVAYVAALRARADLEAAEQSVALRRATFEQIETQARAGYATGADEARARASLLEAESQLLAARLALDESLSALAFLVDLPTLSEDEIEPLEPGELLADEPARHAAVRALALAEQAARVSVRSEWLGFLPAMSFSAGYRLGRSSIFDPTGDAFFAGVTASWDVFRFDRYGRLDASRARADSLRAQRTLLERELAVQEEVARRRHAVADAQRALATQILEAASEVRALEALRMEAGETTALELVTADVEVHRARVALNQAALQVQLALIERAYVTGEMEEEWPR
jgi:outer membrane protein TolC